MTDSRLKISGMTDWIDRILLNHEYIIYHISPYRK
jgi:hypothetical protein